MDLMPNALQGNHQLKSTINILEDKYGDQNTTQPKPRINRNPELENEENYDPSKDRTDEKKSEKKSENQIES